MQPHARHSRTGWDVLLPWHSSTGIQHLLWLISSSATLAHCPQPQQDKAHTVAGASAAAQSTAVLQLDVRGAKRAYHRNRGAQGSKQAKQSSVWQVRQ